jgi:lysophospholipase L1-like esterase
VKKVGYFLFLVYLVMLFIHLKLLFNGQISIITTLLFYITLVLFFLAVIYLLSRVSRYILKKKADYILLIIVLFSSLFVTELILKYGVKTHQSYLEKNGYFFYYSYHWQINKENRNYLNGQRQEKVWYKLNYPGIPWTHSTPEFIQVHNINSSGCRDGEFSINKEPDEYRIIALGDSYTQGVGAPEDSTYADFLERDLSPQFPDKKIVVYNAGNSGSDPFFEYMVLRDKLMIYSPDLVIVAINSSDLQDVSIRGGMERFKPDGTVQYRKGPRWEVLYGISYIFRHIIHDFLAYDWNLVKYKDQKVVLAQISLLLKDSVDRFKVLADEKGFDLMIVFNPTDWEVKTRALILDTLYQSVRLNPDIISLNLNDYYINKAGLDSSNVQDYYWQVDLHHNSKGYELFARGVAEKIVATGLIK